MMSSTSVLRLVQLQSYGYWRSAVDQETIDTFTRARQEGRPFIVVVLDLTIPGGWRS